MSIILLILVFILVVRLFTLFGRRAGFEPESFSVPSVPDVDSMKNVTESYFVTPELEQKIQRDIPGFDAAKFVKTCENLFLDTIDAFQKAHRQQLKKYVSEKVYKSFSKQISKREKESCYMEFLVQDVTIKISEYAICRDHINIDVCIACEQMLATWNAQGESFDNPSRLFVPKMHIWTFCKSFANNAKWKVIAMQEKNR